MADASETIVIDVRQALRDIALLKGGLADLRGQMGQTRQSGQQAFGGIGASAIKEARDIDTLKKKYAEVKAAADQLREALKTAYDPRIISTYTKALGQAEAGLKKIENGAHTAGISLKGVGKQSNELGSAFKSVFAGSFAAGGLIGALELVKQGLQAGIDQALEFEQGLADLSALTGIKGADLDGLEQIVKNLQNINVQGKNIVTTGPEIERALSLVGGSAPELLKNADALSKVTEQAIILSKTSKDLNLEQAVKAITTSMGQFNLVAADGSRIINAFAAASKVGSVEVPRLARELADVGQIAGQTGIDLEETLGAIELFGKAKIPEGRIGVQLRNIFTILSDAKQLPKDAQAAFEKFGVNTDILSDKTQKFEVRLKELQKINGNVPALSAIFGQQNLGGAIQLSTQTELLFKELIPGIRGTSEALDQARIRIDTNKQALENYKNFALNTLSDAFVDFGNDIGTVIGWFTSLEAKIDKIKQPIVDFFNTIEAQRKRVVAFLGFGPDLNPGVDNRTSLDPFAPDPKSNPRAEIEGKIKDAQQKSIATQIELNARRAEAGEIEDKNAKLAETAANKAKARQREREAELREIEQFNKRRAELQLQNLDPKSEAFATAKENLRFADQLAEFKKFKLDTEEIEKQHTKNLLRIQIEFYLERQAKIDKSIQDEKDSIQRGFDELAGLAKDDAERKTKNNENVLRVRSQAEELRAAIFEEQELSNKALFFSKERSDAEIEEYDKRVAKAREIFQLEQQAIALQNLIEFDKTLSSAEVATLETRVKNIQTKIGQLVAGTGEKKDKGKGFLQSLFPDFSGDELDKLKDSLNQAKDEIFGFLQEVSDARLEAADRRLEAAEKEVEAAQLAYDKEKELDATGYADSFKTAEKNLADAKANEEKALQLKREAQKKQLNLDAAMQASSLITAAANTFKGFSSIPLVGQILAVVSIAAMFAAFASAQAKARAAIKFREGGPVEGPSHDHGGVPIEAEGGEFITNRKATAQHFNLLEAVNKRDNPALDRWALGRVAKLDRIAVGQAIGEGKGTTTVIVQTKEDRKAHGYLKRIAERKQPPVTTTEGNYSVTRMNGKTIRKRI